MAGVERGCKRFKTNAAPQWLTLCIISPIDHLGLLLPGVASKSSVVLSLSIERGTDAQRSQSKEQAHFFYSMSESSYPLSVVVPAPFASEPFRACMSTSADACLPFVDTFLA
jgi:hypothetical protein